MSNKGQGLVKKTALSFYWVAIFGICLWVFTVGKALASPQEVLRFHLQKKYPNTEIKVDQDISWKKPMLAKEDSIVSSYEVRPGVYRVEFKNGGAGEFRVKALLRVLVASESIAPGVRLNKKKFEVREVDVFDASYSLFRTALASTDNVLEEYETKQTIVAGEPLLVTAIRKVPDVRKGKQVSVEIVSGGLRVTTEGRSEGTGFVGMELDVQILSTKKKLSGILKSPGLVEVTL